MVVSILETTRLLHLILMIHFQIGNCCSRKLQIIVAQCLYYTACFIIKRKTNEIIRKVRIISFVCKCSSVQTSHPIDNSEILNFFLHCIQTPEEHIPCGLIFKPLRIDLGDLIQPHGADSF